MLQYDAIELDDHLTFVEEPVSILARDVRKFALERHSYCYGSLEASFSRGGYLGDRAGDARVVSRLV